MNKKELKKVSIINIRAEWRTLIEQVKHTDIKFFIAAEKFNKDIMVLNIIDKSKIDKISYRLFINKEDYITQDFTSDSMKWRTGALEYILVISKSRWYEKSISVDKKSNDMLSKFLGVDKDYVFQALASLQRQIKAKKLADKHKVIRDRIDERMKDVPNLPKNFGTWINEKALFNSRYIYYNYKTKEGYCTHCSSDVKVEAAKHNKEAKCPNCKSEITFKSIGKAKKVLDFGKATIIQKAKGKLIIRHFDVAKYYGEEYRNPKLDYIELQRYFCDKDGTVTSYEFNNFKNTGERRWCEGIASNDMYSLYYSKAYDFSETVLYTSNLSKVLKNSILKYSGLKEFAIYKNNDRFSLNSYMKKYLEFPALEYLVKLKLFKLVEDMLKLDRYTREINIKGNNLLEVLGIDKTQLRTLQKINGGLAELETIKGAEKVKLRLSDNQILFVAKYSRIERIIKASKYTTIHRILEYVTLQSSEKRSIDNTLGDWLDYINYCKVLKYDLENDFVLFPRNLTESHDELASLINDNKNELYNTRISEMFESLNKLLSWQYRDSVIMVPESYDDIVKEGNSLKHCVGRGIYGKKIIEGESIILFLRDKNEIDKTFYTIE